MKIPIYERWKERQVDTRSFQTFKTEVAIYNLHTLRQIAWVGAIGGLILILACLPPLRLLTMLHGYAAITVLFVSMVLLSKTLEKHLNLVLPVYYAFVVLLLAISIGMGTVWGKDNNAITFVMLVVVLPLFVIDKPARINIVFGIMCAVFCVVDYVIKDGIMRSMDISNCVVFYLLSVVISRQSINAKMTDIIVKLELKRQRDMDMLTKLSNRGAFERNVEQYIHGSSKNSVMLIMDLDNFKSVNDQMGHEYGDLVLKLVGEYLQDAFRSGDIVSRLGGDEFVAFLPAVEDIDLITEKIKALIARIGGIGQQLKLTCDIGASVGLSRYPQDGGSFEELYRCADAALYSIKRGGKGSFMLYDAQDCDRQ